MLGTTHNTIIEWEFAKPTRHTNKILGIHTSQHWSWVSYCTYVSLIIICGDNVRGCMTNYHVKPKSWDAYSVIAHE